MTSPEPRVLHLEYLSLMGGGQTSLLVLLDALPASPPRALAAPAGPLADRARALGVTVLKIPATEGSLKLHPLHTPRALAEMLAAAIAVRRHARRTGAQVVHANSIRAGLVAIGARALGGPPVVTHVRDVLPGGRMSALIRRAILRGSACVVANSGYVAARFAGAAARSVRVVDNPVDLARFDPAAVDRDAARAELGLPAGAPVLAVVAQITHWKGQDDAVRVLARVREHRPGARLLVAGEAKYVSAATRFDNRTYERELHALVAELGVADAVTFLGEREDPERILAAADLVLVPSLEEPFGRTIIEALALGTPVIATDVGGPPEIVRDGIDGVVLAPREPERWASAALDLLERTPDRAALRAHAAERFSAERHAATMREIYGEVARG